MEARWEQVRSKVHELLGIWRDARTTFGLDVPIPPHSGDPPGNLAPTGADALLAARAAPARA